MRPSTLSRSPSRTRRAAPINACVCMTRLCTHAQRTSARSIWPSFRTQGQHLLRGWPSATGADSRDAGHRQIHGRPRCARQRQLCLPERGSTQYFYSTQLGTGLI
jgi:hypothetical protein